jgi:hypothetical protein
MVKSKGQCSSGDQNSTDACYTAHGHNLSEGLEIEGEQAG